MRAWFLKNYRKTTVFTTLFAILCVVVLILPTVKSIEGYSSVDVGQMLSDPVNNSAEFTYSSFKFQTFGISNVTMGATLLVTITGADSNAMVIFREKPNGFANLGILDSHISSNVFMLKLLQDSEYEMRFAVNDGMQVVFQVFNSYSYNLDDSANFYGYANGMENGQPIFKLGISTGTAHFAMLDSYEELSYRSYNTTTLLLDGELVENGPKYSKNLYLTNLTTELKLFLPTDTTRFHIKLHPTQQYPNSASGGVYYDEETIVLPVSWETYEAIINDPFEPVTFFSPFLEPVVIGYHANVTEVALSKAILTVELANRNISVENGTRHSIGWDYEVVYSNLFEDTIPFNVTFSALKFLIKDDDDGDGFPIFTFDMYNVSLSNGTPIIETQIDMGDVVINTDMIDPILKVGDVSDSASQPVFYKDLDNDNLGNEGELFVYGTNPLLTDTDGDELSDGAEAVYWDNLLSEMFGDEPPWWTGIYHSNLTTDWERRAIFRATGDLDYDGVANINDPDSDGDGLLDGWEYSGIQVWLHGETREYFLEPFLPDFDHDGVSDGAEIWNFFTFQKVPSQYVAEGMFYDETSESGADILLRRSAVLSLPTHYLRFRFDANMEPPGYYRIKLLTREYGENPTLAGEGFYDDILNVTLYHGDDPFEEAYNFSLVYNITGNNVTTNLSMDDLNLVGSRSWVYNVTEPGSFTVEVRFKEDYDTIDSTYLLVVDDILIQQQGLDPIEPDFDDDGLGDGNMTWVEQTLYFVGEETYGSFPLNDDSDHDGLLDGEEVNLSDSGNYTLFTDPLNMDTDYDGLIDGDQLIINSNEKPQLFNILYRRGIYNETSDNITYSFYGEGYFGTNATNFDTDGDGLLDGKSIDVVYASNRYWNWIDTISNEENAINFTTYKLIFTFEDGNWVSLEPAEGGLDPYTFTIGAHRFIGENETGTDSILFDTDDDSLPDGWEHAYGLDPLDGTGDNGGDGNPDGDGANNSMEYAYQMLAGQIGVYWGGTDITNEDTDGDSVLDGSNITLTQGNPNYDVFTDMVYDQLDPTTRLFYGEDSHATDAKDYDTDRDWMPDGWELRYDFSPLDNGSANATGGPEGDPDYDGVANIHEFNYRRRYYQPATYWGGTSPLEEDSDSDGLLDGYLMVLDFTDPANDTAVTYLNDSGILRNLTDKNITYYGELSFGTHPLRVDSDGDGLLDGFNITVGPSDERYNWPYTYVDEGNERTFLGEWNLTTDPAVLDSDGDSWLDGENITVTSSDPRYEDWKDLFDYRDNDPPNSRRYLGDLGMLSDPVNWDTDGDGLSDSLEHRYEMKYTNVDSDGDLLPDSVEPLWNVDMIDAGPSLINALDDNSNNDNEEDNEEVYVLFRTTSHDYGASTYVAIYLENAPEGAHTNINPDEPDYDLLDRFKFVSKNVEIPENALLVEFTQNEGISEPLLTPEGFLIYWLDDSPDDRIYIDNGTFEGVTEFVYDSQLDDNDVPDQIILDSSVSGFSLGFRETYDWANYLDDDGDDDGVPNAAEGFGENAGWDIVLGEDTYTVQTAVNNPDTDNDGLLDGEDVLLEVGSTAFSDWKNLYNYTIEGDLARFYGEVTYRSLPGDATAPTITDTYDSDGDGLLDGANRTFTSNDDEYNDWATAGIYYTQFSSTRVFWGELNLSTNPMSADTDGDTISDKEEVITGSDGYITDPTSKDTDWDGINDNVEVDGVEGPKGTYQTDPTSADTDGDIISDYNETFGWRINTIKADGIVTQTAYGNPTTLWSREDNNYHLNDTALLTLGGNPLADQLAGGGYDTDGDGIEDETEYDPNDYSTNTSIMMQEIYPPEFGEVTFYPKVEYKAFTVDLGWFGSKTIRVPVNVYLEVSVWVHDLGGVKAVDIRIDSPNRMDWTRATLLPGYTQQIDGKTYQLYRATFGMDLGFIMLGTLYEFRGQIRAWDLADNFNQIEAKQDGVLKILVAALVNLIVSTLAAAMEAAITAIKFLISLRLSILIIELKLLYISLDLQNMLLFCPYYTVIAYLLQRPINGNSDDPLSYVHGQGPAHFYIGTQLRRLGCGYYCTYTIASAQEEIMSATPNPEDLRITMWGWVRHYAEGRGVSARETALLQTCWWNPNRMVYNPDTELWENEPGYEWKGDPNNGYELDFNVELLPDPWEENTT